VVIDLVWRIGPRWLAVLAAAVFGAAVGFVAGVVLTGSPLDAAKFFTVGPALCMPMQVVRLRREWPGGSLLSRSDRAKVLDAVRDGTDVADPALASETVVWANARRYYAERDDRQWPFAMVALGVLLFWVGGSAVESRNWLLLVSAVLLGVVDVWWFGSALPPRLARTGDRAWVAEGFAQRLVAREHFL
jgi:hypothetical protein